MKTRMKLLDYTLISLLGTCAPAVWAQSAAAPAADQTVLKIKSEGEAGSVDTSQAGLQAYRRVDVTQVNPGGIPVSGKFLINLPAGGVVWATEDPQLVTPVLNAQASTPISETRARKLTRLR